MSKSASLQFRLSLWIGLVVLALGALPVGYFARVTRAEALEKARIRMLATARQEAATVQAPLTKAMDVARTLAQSLAALKEGGRGISREEANAILRRTLAENPDFLDTYTVWEPDAFDGMDARYARTPGHDASGRFVPVWNRDASGKIECEPALAYEAAGMGDYYLIPRATRSEAVIEPFLYPLRGQAMFITSLVAPILVNGTFRGIAGVDYQLPFLQRLADHVSLYEGTGRLYIVSATGLIVGATGSPDRVGQRSGPGLEMPWVPRDGIVASGGDLYAATTISIGAGSHAWQVVLKVPEKAITADVDRRIAILVGEASIVVLLGVACTLFLLRRKVVARLRRLTDATEALASGAYDTACDIQGEDELARLGTAFNAMAARIAESVGALQEREALLKGAFDNGLHFYALLATQGDMEFCNRTALDAIGADLASVVGRPFWEQPWWSHAREQQDRIRQAVGQAALGEVYRADETYRSASGELRQIDFSLAPLRDGRGEVIHLIAEGRDVTVEKEMSAALKMSEERYRHIVEYAPLGIFRTRLGDGFVFASQGILRQYEVSSLEELNRLYGNTDRRWPKPGDYEKYLEEIRRKKQFLGYEVETRLVSGRTEWHLLYAYLDEDDCHVNGFIVDITEQRRLREQLNQSQKIEAVGQLAGGVAHDFNNSLAGIIGAAELLREGAALDEENRHYVDMILSVAERAGQLTRKLLAFSRKAAKTSTVVDVGAIINDTSAILRRTLDRRIEIVVENRAPSAQVVGDDALLQNAFLNMGINAGYAMPEGGRLTFALENTTLDEAYCSRSAFPLEPGDYLEIAVEDTGCGMSQETLKRIFEPFFTTREQERGRAWAFRPSTARCRITTEPSRCIPSPAGAASSASTCPWPPTASPQSPPMPPSSRAAGPCS